MSYSKAKAIVRNSFGSEWRQRLKHWNRRGQHPPPPPPPQLDRTAQVTILRLRTGHCQHPSLPHRLTFPTQMNAHELQVLKLQPLSAPPFGALRRQTWPSPVDAYRKLWEPVGTLRQTVPSIDKPNFCPGVLVGWSVPQ